MGDARHGVVQVGHVGRAGGERLFGGLVTGAGVGDGDAHLAAAAGDKVQRAVLLRGHVHQLDQPAGPLLQAAEHVHVGLVQILGVLRADLVRADEGAFHVDAHQVGAAAVFVGRRRVHDAAQDLLAVGHGGGADGKHAFAGFKVRQRLDGLLAGVAEIVAYRAVEMQVQQARQGIQALRVDDLLIQLRRCAEHDPAAADDDVPLGKHVLRGVNHCVFDNHGKSPRFLDDGVRSGSGPRRRPPA